MGKGEIDGAYVGGQDKNHYWNRKIDQAGGEACGKVSVIGVITRKGNIVCQAIENTKCATLNKFVKETVDSDITLLATDEYLAAHTDCVILLPYDSTEGNWNYYKNRI